METVGDPKLYKSLDEFFDTVHERLHANAREKSLTPREFAEQEIQEMEPLLAKFDRGTATREEISAALMMTQVGSYLKALLELGTETLDWPDQATRHQAITVIAQNFIRQQPLGMSWEEIVNLSM
jgi:hypothetical protein